MIAFIESDPPRGDLCLRQFYFQAYLLGRGGQKLLQHHRAQPMVAETRTDREMLDIDQFIKFPYGHECLDKAADRIRQCQDLIMRIAEQCLLSVVVTIFNYRKAQFHQIKDLVKLILFHFFHSTHLILLHFFHLN